MYWITYGKVVGYFSHYLEIFLFTSYMKKILITINYFLRQVFSLPLMFSEHVERAYPERLLPPLMDLPIAATLEVCRYKGYR